MYWQLIFTRKHEFWHFSIFLIESKLACVATCLLEIQLQDTGCQIGIVTQAWMFVGVLFRFKRRSRSVYLSCELQRLQLTKQPNGNFCYSRRRKKCICNAIYHTHKFLALLSHSILDVQQLCPVHSSFHYASQTNPKLWLQNFRLFQFSFHE